MENEREPLVELHELSKSFGEIQAVRGISTRIYAGEVVGFLGPNGAGKTTTMRMITTYLPPTSGNAWVGGHEVTRSPMEVRSLIGYLPETPPLYGEMRVRTYLRFVAELKGIERSRIPSRLDWVIEACGLKDVENRVIRTLSRGYRQRLGLAQALIHDPKVLILDEPTSGLDPNQILEIRALIRQLAEGRTILLSTHILQEVESVCNRVLIIHRGELVYDTEQEKPKGIFYHMEIAEGSPPPPNQWNGFIITPRRDRTYEVEIPVGHHFEELLHHLLANGIKIQSFNLHRYNLEQIFFECTHKEETSSSPVDEEVQS